LELITLRQEVYGLASIARVLLWVLEKRSLVLRTQTRAKFVLLEDGPRKLVDILFPQRVGRGSTSEVSRCNLGGMMIYHGFRTLLGMLSMPSMRFAKILTERRESST